MQRHISTLFAILVGVSFSTFGQHIEGYRQNENNLYFKFLQDEKGSTAKLGDVLSMHMVMKSSDGIELKNTYKERGGKSMLFPVKFPVFLGDIYEAVTLLSEGDSAKFLIPADSMYNRIFKKPLPPSVTEGSSLDFTIKVEWIKAQQDVPIPEQTVKLNVLQRSKDEEAIEAYFNKNELDFKRTDSGVFIHVMSESGNNLIKKGQTLTMNYTGMYVNGQIFETTIKENGDHQPITVVSGNEQVIKGWEESFLELRAGSTYRIGVPSKQAFGVRGRGIVPSNTVLIFEINIITVK